MPREPDDTAPHIEPILRARALILRARAAILSKELDEVELSGALVFAGPERRQAGAVFIPLFDGRQVFAPECLRYIPVIFECPDARRFYAWYTTGGYQDFGYGLERMPLVELDAQDYVRLRQDQDISQFVVKVRDRSPRGGIPATGIFGGAGASRNPPSEADPAAAGPPGIPPGNRQAAGADASGKEPPSPEEDADTESRVAQILHDKPRTKSTQIARKLGLDPKGRTVRNTKAWQANRDRLKEEKRERLDALRHRKPLTRKLLAVVRSAADDPADIAAERQEVLTRMYLEQASGEEKAEFYRMKPEEREHQVNAWALTNGMP
jgi:hypothetical protein